MKDKNKKILGISLAVVSVAVVIVCLYIFLGAGEMKTDFVPGASPEPPTSSWAASAAPKATVSPSPSPTPKAQSSQAEYPKVVKETSSEVVVDFTEPEEPAKEPAPEPAAPPAPESPPDDDESYDPPPTQGETGGGGGQTDGGGGGTVYDPVFGDVTPGQGQPQEVDNDGDPDKIVGIM